MVQLPRGLFDQGGSSPHLTVPLGEQSADLEMWDGRKKGSQKVERGRGAENFPPSLTLFLSFLPPSYLEVGACITGGWVQQPLKTASPFGSQLRARMQGFGGLPWPPFFSPALPPSLPSWAGFSRPSISLWDPARAAPEQDVLRLPWEIPDKGWASPEWQGRKGGGRGCHPRLCATPAQLSEACQTPRASFYRVYTKMSCLSLSHTHTSVSSGICGETRRCQV